MYNIAIFCGGKSLESDISVVTALSLAKVLKLNRRDFILWPLGIDELCEWHQCISDLGQYGLL